MRCNHCGFENPQDFQYCPNCGSVISQEFATRNPVAESILGVLQDKLFLAVCILITVGCGLYLFDDNISVINILLTIFLWLTYSKARKGIADAEHLRCVSGTVYASYVVSYVVCGLIILSGLLLAMVFGLFSQNTGMIYEFLDEFGISGSEIFPSAGAGMAELVFSLFGWIIFIVLALIAAGGILINIYGMRKIHRFVKSTYMSLQSCNVKIEKPAAVKNWLIVFGIFSTVSAVSSLLNNLVMAALAEGCITAATFLGSMLVRKYFVTEKLG